MLQSPLVAALTYYGERPIKGILDNANIVSFIEATKYPPPIHDEIPWCSAFLVWIFQQCCVETPANAAALSWLQYSEHTDQPTIGDIVVLGWPKEAPTAHHVGFYIREVENGIYILAGNQNEEVDITLWKKEDVVSYRRYVGA